MNLNAFFQKNWTHFAIFGAVLVVLMVYFSPQLSGNSLDQHDNEQFQGMSNELVKYKEKNGEISLWTNSMFGGMPATQIYNPYSGNLIYQAYFFFLKNFQAPMGIVFLHFAFFYIMCMLLKIRPWVAFIGGLIYCFATYEIILLQVGHLSKAAAGAVIPAVIGAFIASYRGNWRWGIPLSALFMTLELTTNHVQVTYYFGFLLLFLGIYFGISAVISKKIKQFLFTTLAMILAYSIAVGVNYGNITGTQEYAAKTIRGGSDITITPDGTSKGIVNPGLDKEYITNWSYGIDETFTFLSPYYKGGGSASQKIPNEVDEEEYKSLVDSHNYWGSQPITSGPFYVGLAVLVLAFLSLLLEKSLLNWFLLGVTILVTMLSWGKNFMGLTEFFIENVPLYNKFRAVTIILMVVQLTLPLMGVLFLNKLIESKELFFNQRKKLFIGSGVFFIVAFIVLIAGGSDLRMPNEREQLETRMKQQLSGMPADQLMQQYQIDFSKPMDADSRISSMAASQLEASDEIRGDIYTSSTMRSLFFLALFFGLIIFFILGKINQLIFLISFGFFAFIDVLLVSYNYLGSQKDLTDEYVYWKDAGEGVFPFQIGGAEEQIYKKEIALNPSLKTFFDKGMQDGLSLANERGFNEAATENCKASYAFYELGAHTNYRVFDIRGGFNSSRASYFHKSIGGYHGAKLQSIQNLYEFHVSRMNNEVLNMMNVKYIINSVQAENDTAMFRPESNGAVWLVKDVKVVNSSNEEILNLGARFEMNNVGNGQLLINNEVKKAGTIWTNSSARYIRKSGDTVDVTMASSSDIQVGFEIAFVEDETGKTNLIPKGNLAFDTAQSFNTLVEYKMVAKFDSKNQVVVSKEQAKNLSQKEYSGNGNIKMTSYAPNKIVYSADLKGKQLAVFSEMYYSNGWKAFVDGKEIPILKVNYLLRALELNGGKHKIEFTYDSDSYNRSNSIALIFSLILLIGLAMFIYFNFRSKKAEITSI